MSSPWKDFPNNKTERPFEGIPAGQEPEVMPGFTAPATDPWPPLSREQVVELHEALIEFLKAPMKAPNRLAMRLLALNIGTPPQSRRWTNDDIQAALEKREEPTASLVSSPLGATLCPLCRGSGQARSVQQINPDGSYEPKDAPLVNCMVCEGTGQISPEDEVQEEVKRNCGTCRNVNLPFSMRCAIADEGTAQRGWRDRLAIRSTSEQQLIDLLISSETPCPGWEPKP